MASDGAGASRVTTGTRSSFFGTINQVFRCVFDLAGARPPVRLPRLNPAGPPRRGFAFQAEAGKRSEEER
jgi:hypothetical protein